MRTQRSGAKGPELSVIGFGAWEAGGDDWGPNRSESEVIDAIVAGIDAGMNWVDTAEVYGDGVSETLVGKALAGRRDAVLLATKVAPAPEGTGFRPEQVRAACDASLGRLGIDVIDLYQLHWPDQTGVPVEDTWGAMGGRRRGVACLRRAQVRCSPGRGVGQGGREAPRRGRGGGERAAADPFGEGVSPRREERQRREPRP